MFPEKRPPVPAILLVLLSLSRQQRRCDLSSAPEILQRVFQPDTTLLEKSVKLVPGGDAQYTTELRTGDTMDAIGFDCHIFQSLAGRIEAYGNDLTASSSGC
jgi:hypothetical protein